MALPAAPLRFVPILKTYLWGGTRLASRRPDLPPVFGLGESWELADRPEARSVVAAGPLAGKTLHDLFAADRDALCGHAVDPASPDVFPLLLKLLDPVQDLSVQVHPDDAHAGARRPGELGKTEAWYVLEADPGAVLYTGLAEGVDPDRFRRALADGTVADALRSVPARPGDVFHLPAGTIHALGAGVRIAEIQQNSNTTYRVFDWNRVDAATGRPRDLHIEDALAVAAFGPPGRGAREDAAGRAVPESVPQAGGVRERFVHDEKFALERLRAFERGGMTLSTENGFRIVLAAKGGATVRTAGGETRLGPWDSALVPAAAGTFSVATDADAELLLFYRP